MGIGTYDFLVMFALSDSDRVVDDLVGMKMYHMLLSQPNEWIKALELTRAIDLPLGEVRPGTANSEQEIAGSAQEEVDSETRKSVQSVIKGLEKDLTEKDLGEEEREEIEDKIEKCKQYLVGSVKKGGRQSVTFRDANAERARKAYISSDEDRRQQAEKLLLLHYGIT